MKIAKCFRVIGTLLILAVIVLCLPMVVPKILGWSAYEVVSSSMEPELPIGSVIYTSKCDANEIEVGDIISFYVGTDRGNIISHRVVEIVDDLYYTKGDANTYNDDEPIDFEHILGKEVYSQKNIKWLVDLFNSSTGIIIICGLLLISFVMYVSSDIIAKEKMNITKEKLLIIVAVVIILIASVNLIKILTNYKQSNDLYEKLSSDYTVENVIDNSSNWYDIKKVDFESLSKINKDIVGWIYFEGNGIDYPIMYSGDDDKYLRTSFDNKKATAGSIFLEGSNNSDLEDEHSIIYGHNMRNLSMFGLLKMYIRDDDYYDNNNYFQIMTPDKTYRYEIFSYETVAEDSNIYTISFENRDKFIEFKKTLLNNSQKNTNIDVSGDDKIITLSTCSTFASDKRFVVHAVRVDEYPAK